MSEITNLFTVEYRKDWSTLRALLTNQQFNGYLGWVGYGNLGDESVFQAYQHLFPNANLKVCRTIRPLRSVITKTRHTMPMRSFALGGGTLINQDVGWLEQAQFLVDRGVPGYCLGTGVASRQFWARHPGVHSADHLDAWAKVLKQFMFVGVRGPHSQAALRKVGINATVVGDSALALANAHYPPRKTKKIIGINVSSAADGAMWGNQEVYLREIAKATRQLINLGFVIHLLPVWQDDIMACQTIVDAVGHRDCRLIIAYDNLDSYMQAIDECHIFIGQKLHSTIFATMQRVPAIMLEYRPKCLDYMSSLDMQHYNLRTNKVTSDSLLALVDGLLTNHKTVQYTLDQKIRHYRNLQFQQAAKINKQLYL